LAANSRANISGRLGAAAISLADVTGQCQLRGSSASLTHSVHAAKDSLTVVAVHPQQVELAACSS